MHPFLRTLYEDHEIISHLLNVFDRELAVFENAGHPDYEILNDGVEYCSQYMDAVHHRKEEQMLKQLREVDPSSAARVADLTPQHKQLERLTHQVAAAFAAARDDAVASREEMVAPAREWIQAYRDHLQWEEINLFAVAEQRLDKAHWDAAFTEWEHIANPLHSTAQHHRFAELALVIEQIASY